MRVCNHLFVDGLGLCGDAVVCVRCGLDKYPEALPVGALAIAAMQGLVIKEDHPLYKEWLALAHAARIYYAPSEDASRPTTFPE